MNNRSFVEVRELCHIVRFVKLGRVHFINAIGLNFTLLALRSAQFSPFTLALRSHIPIVTLNQ